MSQEVLKKMETKIKMATGTQLQWENGSKTCPWVIYKTFPNKRNNVHLFL